jgi:hypothetical protein
MNTPNDNSGKRKIAIGASITLLMLTAFGCDYFKAKDEKVEYSGNKVTVVSFSSRKIQLPEGFEKAFGNFTGIMLVDSKVTAINPKGKTINLCDPVAKAESDADCDVVLTTFGLLDALSGEGSCGRCNNYECSLKTNKRPCDRGIHSCRCR